MIPLSYAIYLGILGIALGYLIRSAMTVKRRINTDTPYFKGQGDPQPYEWTPDVADAFRRKGAV